MAGTIAHSRFDRCIEITGVMVVGWGVVTHTPKIGQRRSTPFYSANWVA